MANGNEYTGQYENDRFHGQGTYKWPSGKKYVGQFANNNFNGQGTMHYADGISIYEGSWKDGMRHGAGKVTGPGLFGIGTKMRQVFGAIM